MGKIHWYVFLAGMSGGIAFGIVAKSGSVCFFSAVAITAALASIVEAIRKS